MPLIDPENTDPSPLDDDEPQPLAPMEADPINDPFRGTTLDDPTATDAPEDQEPATMVQADVNIAPPEPGLTPENNRLGHQYLAYTPSTEEVVRASLEDSEPISRSDLGAESDSAGFEPLNPAPLSRSTPDSDPALLIDRASIGADSEFDAGGESGSTNPPGVTDEPAELALRPGGIGEPVDSVQPASRVFDRTAPTDSSSDVPIDQDWGSGARASTAEDSDPIAAAAEAAAVEVPDPEPEPLVMVEADPVEAAFADSDSQTESAPVRVRGDLDAESDADEAVPLAPSTGREVLQRDDPDDGLLDL